MMAITTSSSISVNPLRPPISISLMSFDEQPR
jgi:hypothetical protein